MIIFYRTLEIINWIIIGLTTIGFIFQILYVMFSWLKPKHFPHSNNNHRFAILICARNEESVIENTIKKVLNNQTYPKNLYDVFVCAHNCTDNTASIAKKCGATVYELNDLNPYHMNLGHAQNYLIHMIKVNYPNKYDAFIKFDADNILKEDYIERMNDALSCGCNIARPYEFSLNPTQNNWSKVSATYYMRDSRLPSNFRERTNMSSMLTGAGMMVSMKYFKDEKEWDALGFIEDSEFTVNRMLEGEKIHYVADAIIYEDQPSTFKDTYKRNKRLGYGLSRLFFKKGLKLLLSTFKFKSFSYIDLFFQIMFVPIAIICCIWFPAYYIFYIIMHMVNAWGINILQTAFSTTQSITTLIELCKFIGIVVGSFYLIYVFQTWLACILSKKHLGLKNLKGFYSGILLSPLFMLVYAISITIGSFSKPNWKPVSRNINQKIK